MMRRAYRAGYGSDKLRAQLERRTVAFAAPPNGVANARSSDEHTDDALKSSEALRAQLEQISAERKLTQERVNQNLNEMSTALDSILAKLRGVETPPPKPASEPAPTDDTEATPSPPAPSAPTPVATDASDDDVEPYMDPSQFGLDSTSGWQVLANSDSLPESDSAAVKFRIECDGTGCSIIEMEADAAPGPGVRAQWVQKGRGYRVGYDPDAPDSFCGMVGTEQWLLALDKQETRHFKRLVTAVARKMARIDRGDERPPGPRATPAVRRSGDGMFNERVALTEGAGCSVEMESKLMWVQAVGKPRLGAYSLRVILMEKRQSEGYWAPDVVPAMLVAVAKLAIE